jgi:urate oxidase
VAARLGAHRYGKSEVRLVKLTRGPERHDLRDLTVDVMLEGDYEAVHATGDNTGLVATDTMRNVVYALAAEQPLDSLPAFGAALVEHFLGYERVTEATVRLREHPWQRLPGPGGGHRHAWQRGAGGTRVEEARGGARDTRMGEASGEGAGLRHASGVEDLLLLRSSGSAFEGFDRDRFTTLPETGDRILATAVAARWEYAQTGASDLEPAWARVRDRLLEAFTDHDSPSVQFTLHRMGQAVLEAHPEIERIHLSLPNRHHLPFDVSRFGVEDRGEVFHATTEPFGLIEATVERA